MNHVLILQTQKIKCLFPSNNINDIILLLAVATTLTN